MLKKSTKRQRFLLIAVVLFFFVGFCCFRLWSESDFGRCFLFRSDYKNMQQVAEYLSSLEYSDVLIHGPFGKMIIGPGGESAKIEDPKIKGTICLLFLKGYDRIEKNDDKTVCFQRWSNYIFGCFRGYAFSLDGSEELSIEFLTEKQKMPQKDWYYYVDDYNQWRADKMQDQ